MMKRIFILLLFSLINISILSQNLKNNFSIGFNYNNNKLKTYSGVLNTTTNYQKKWLVIDNVLNENISFTNKINQNELSNKLSIGISKNRHSGFINYQTNYSLTRNLNLDHLIGLGFGQRDSIYEVKLNYSYAILWQTITNQNINKIRNSFRLKISQKKLNYNWNIEYYYQPDLINYKDYIIYGTTKFTYKVKKLGLSVINIVNYNSFLQIKIINTVNAGFTYEIGE